MIIKYWVKRIFSILLATFLLTGCSASQEILDNLNTGIILLWLSFNEEYYPKSLISQYREVFSDYIGKFNKLYPQVKIITEVKDEQDLIKELESELDKGLGPDLIFTNSTNILRLIKAKALRPLEKDALDLLQFRFEALDQFFSQDKMYGVPLELLTQALCYNKKNVKQVPETLSELITQSRAGYSVGIISNFEDTFWGTQIFGGQLLDAQGDMILDQGLGWIRWMEWLKNAKTEPNIILNENSLILQNAFIEEDLAYMVCSSFQIPFLRDSLGSDKFGVALLPGEENQPAGPHLIVNGLLFSSTSSDHQNQIALKFAQFLANEQQQTDLAAELRSFIPANREATVDLRLFPTQGILQKQSQTAIAFTLDQTEKINIIRKYGQDFYKRVMVGEISPEEAASQLTQAVNAQFEDP